MMVNGVEQKSQGGKAQRLPPYARYPHNLLISLPGLILPL